MAVLKSDAGAQLPLLVSLCDLRPASEKEFGIAGSRIGFRMSGIVEDRRGVWHCAEHSARTELSANDSLRSDVVTEKT